MSKQDVADFIDVLAARIVELEEEVQTLTDLGDDMAATGTGFADFVAARKAWRENR